MYIKSIYILFLLLFLTKPLSAQTGAQNDWLLLYDGSSIRGKLLVQTPELVTFQLQMGETIKVPMENVKSIILEKTNKEYFAKGKTLRKKGYYFDLLLSLHPYIDYYEAVDLTLQVVNGYKFNSKHALGIGTGILPLAQLRAPVIPFYLEYKYTPFRKRVMPYFYTGLGYGIVLDDGKSTVYTGHRGGMHARIGAGFTFASNNNAKFIIGTSFLMQRASFSELNWGPTRTTYDFRRFSLDLGFTI